MKRKALINLLIVLILLVTLTQATKTQQIYTLDQGLAYLTKSLVEKAQIPLRARLAVVPLVDYGNKETRFGNFCSEELTTRLFSYQRFDLVERQLLEKAIKEIKLQNPRAGITDPKTAIKLGKLLNAEAILVGSYEDLGYTMKINARIISIEFGNVLSAAGVEIEKAKIPESSTDVHNPEDKSGPIIEINQTIYFGGDWLTVIFDSIELVAGNFLQFNFTVRNPFEDEVKLRLDRPEENTYLVDNYGSSYDYASSILKIGIKPISDNSGGQIRPGERASLSIIFKAPTNMANYVTLRTEWTASGRNVYGTKNIVQKNLPVPGR